MTAQRGNRPVVVGVDGSDSALRAVGWAARQARSWRAPLRLVHAHLWPWMSFTGGMAETVLPHDYQKSLLDVATGWLRDAAGHARAAAPDVEVHDELVVAAPATVLVTESETARLVVLGSRGLGGFTGLLVGSVAVTLAAHACCPVAVIRTAGNGTDGADGTDAAEAPASGPVVVGVDGTTGSDPAIEWAFDHASRTSSPLVAVHAWTDITYAIPYVPPPPDYRWPDLSEDERRLLAERMAGWQEKYPDVHVQRVVTEGRPAHSLLTAVTDPQLIVVGSRGRSGLRGLVLGSTSQALIHHAPCPVVVTRQQH